MQTERIILRPRFPAESMDLGFHLTRANWPAAAGLTLVGLVPIAALAALSFLWHPSLALLVLWWFKPTLDRPVLDLLSRDLTGRDARAGSTLRQPQSWWSGGHLAMLLLYRLHPARSAVLPIWQLERLEGARRRQRTRSLGHGNSGGGAGLTFIAGLIELCLIIGIIVLLSSVLPHELWAGFETQVFFEFGEVPPQLWALIAISYALCIVLVEPFYAGGGFGLYLNQRCRLECWDLEPVLRKLAGRHRAEQAA